MITFEKVKSLKKNDIVMTQLLRVRSLNERNLIKAFSSSSNVDTNTIQYSAATKQGGKKPSMRIN